MNRTDVQSLLGRIEKLNEIGIRLSTEKDTDRLLEQILLGAKELTNADGGTLYTVTEDQQLKFEIMQTDSLGFAMGGSTGVKIPFPPIPMYDDHGRPNDKMVVSYAAVHDQVVNIPDAYIAEGFDFSGTRAFDAKTGYRSTSFLTVPLKNQEDVIIGVLQLLNAIDPATGEIVPFSEADQRLVSSMASQAAVTLTKKRLIQDLKTLFEALIQLIATAIDDKSPTTGKHCRRVPVITMLLADAVSATRRGPLRDFVLDENDRYELEIAAWLHDCGKITTPEHIVGKSRKLETLYDRIDLVETRFELLRRDQLLEQCRAADPGDPPDQSVSDAQLLEDLAFLKKCNTGGEFMAAEDQQRVNEIAQRYRWHSHSGEQHPALTEDEVYNLTISKGTLTPEERQAINDHVRATIKILNSLPFPKHLKHVPEFAGGHHERIDGKGYPNGLTGAQMSVQAKIIAVADVFEALTAKDRAYKKGKTLSETLKIMGFMCQEGHIDPDLFNIFVGDEIYLKYAQEYLNPEQIDRVIPEQIPGISLE